FPVRSCSFSCGLFPAPILVVLWAGTIQLFVYPLNTHPLLPLSQPSSHPIVSADSLSGQKDGSVSFLLKEASFLLPDRRGVIWDRISLLGSFPSHPPFQIVISEMETWNHFPRRSSY